MDAVQTKNLISHIKSEYQSKFHWLEKLQQEIIAVQALIEHELSRLPESENENKVPGSHGDEIDEAVLINKKLQKISSYLTRIQTDGSREHTYLKYLQHHKFGCPGNIAAEAEDVTYVVKDLSTTHDRLCRTKEEIENSVNKAYRKQAKIQIKMSQYFTSAGECVADRMMNEFVSRHVSVKKRKSLSEGKQPLGAKNSVNQ